MNDCCKSLYDTRPPINYIFEGICFKCRKKYGDLKITKEEATGNLRDGFWNEWITDDLSKYFVISHESSVDKFYPDLDLDDIKEFQNPITFDYHIPREEIDKRDHVRKAYIKLMLWETQCFMSNLRYAFKKVTTSEDEDEIIENRWKCQHYEELLIKIFSSKYKHEIYKQLPKGLKKKMAKEWGLYEK